MAQVIIKGSERAIAEFCSWFSNSGEQGLMECWADSNWNPATHQYEDSTTYLGTRAYSEVIELVEYDKETDEEVFYNMFGQQITKEELEASQKMIAENASVQLMTSPTGQVFNLKAQND